MWYEEDGVAVSMCYKPAIFFVKRVLPDSPAERAGVRTGDRIFSVDGDQIWEIEEFIEKVHSSAGKAIKLGVLREGELLEIDVTPKPERTTDFLGRTRTIGKIGVEFYPSIDIGFMEPLKLDFARSVVYAVNKNIYWTRVTAEAFWRIIAGKISFRSVGGPIMIAKLAGEAASMGWLPYLFLMAIISLNLFVINLFPVPALDGGMLVLLLVESIRRKPMEMKFLEAYQKIGFALLMLLVALVFYNDISRYWTDIGEAIKGVFK
ncbi:MAG TPA: RIP metalloprotease RseP [Proteobacteria bacterium]|nr:RIP metalloprotease RseP [Pseudomonadota bacterium]